MHDRVTDGIQADAGFTFQDLAAAIAAAAPDARYDSLRRGLTASRASARRAGTAAGQESDCHGRMTPRRPLPLASRHPSGRVGCTSHRNSKEAGRDPASMLRRDTRSLYSAPYDPVCCIRVAFASPATVLAA
jgi:hypothetical protein